MKEKMKLGIILIAGAAIVQAVVAYAQQSSQDKVIMSIAQYNRLVELGQSDSQTEEGEDIKLALRDILKNTQPVSIELPRAEEPGP